MAFASATSNAQTALGPELLDVGTNNLGFKSIAGDVKLRLPTAWQKNAAPHTYSSLLSINSAKGLLAAAGPGSLIIASTQSIRQAFKDAKSKDQVIQFTPQLSIPVPRLSHVSFTSDGSCLILAAEENGGLAAHSVEALLNKETNPAFELATGGISIKALVPNPAPELAHLVAVLMMNGHLMIANFQDRKFSTGVNGASIKDGVTSVAWSVRGKQLVVGLLDGSAMQLDPQGAVKATIPKPPRLRVGMMSKLIRSLSISNSN
jgi:nucleoporin NUP159